MCVGSEHPMPRSIQAQRVEVGSLLTSEFPPSLTMGCEVAGMRVYVYVKGRGGPMKPSGHVDARQRKGWI